MATIHLTGRITESGKLEIDLPDGLPPGEVQVTIQVPASEPPKDSSDWENQPWTEEEIRDFLTFEPKTAAEIADSDAVGGWAHTGITDSVAFIEELRLVWMEIVGGAVNKQEQLQARKVLDQFEMVCLTQADFNWAMQQQLAHQLSYGIGILDCLMASPSHRPQLPLYTPNLKHLTPLLGPLAQNPY